MGASIGSFLLVILRRGHNDDWKSWLTGKSFCETCKKELKWYELIPTISYLCLLGKCSKCKSKIDPSHFLCETVFGITFTTLFVLFRYQYIDLYKFIFLLIANSILIILSTSDFLYRDINVIPVYLLGAIGLAYNALVYHKYINIAIVIGLFVVLGFLCRKDNFSTFGSGDIDVIIAIFALVASAFSIIDIILYAAFAGIVLYLTICRNKDKAIPFVPCLYFGYILSTCNISVSRILSDLVMMMFEL